MQYTLPDLFAHWPYKRKSNPHFKHVSADSFNFFRQSGLLDLHPELFATYKKNSPALYVALGLPNVSQDVLRVAMDIFTFAIFLDVTCRSMSPEDAEDLLCSCMDVIITRRDDEYINLDENRLWPQVFGKIILRAWKLPQVQAGAVLRLVASIERWIMANDEATRVPHPTSQYMELRRETIGFETSMALLQLQHDLSDFICDNPIVEDAYHLAEDMLCVLHDIYAFGASKQKATDHNIVSIAMTEQRLSVQAAMNLAGSQFRILSKQYQRLEDQAFRQLRENPQMYLYVKSMSNWITASLYWSFESRRYFNKRGSEVLMTRRVSMYPAVRKEYDICDENNFGVAENMVHLGLMTMWH